MRVLLLITDLQRGGTPLRLLRWSNWLPQIGIEPVVGCLASRGPLSDDLDRRGVPHFACDAGGRFDAGAMFRLARHIRRENPDLVHAFLFHANLAARLVGRLDRRRPIVTSTATVEIERGWHRALERLTAGLSDRHVVNAPTVARHCVDELGFDPRRVVVVPNGLDLDAIDAAPALDRAALGLPDSTRLLVWVGRMDPIKDLPTWVDVFERLQRGTPVAGVWIGDGPMRPQLLELLRRRNLCAEDAASAAPARGATRGNAFMNDAAASAAACRLEAGRIHMAGWQSNPIGWLKIADALLLTSRTEGVPNVVLEAMAAGCPVIATGVGGVRDWIDDGRTGWLFQPGDADAAAQRLIQLWRDDSTRSDVRRAARAAISTSQSPAQVLRALDSLYRTIRP